MVRAAAAPHRPIIIACSVPCKRSRRHPRMLPVLRRRGGAVDLDRCAGVDGGCRGIEVRDDGAANEARRRVMVGDRGVGGIGRHADVLLISKGVGRLEMVVWGAPTARARLVRVGMRVQRVMTEGDGWLVTGPRETHQWSRLTRVLPTAGESGEQGRSCEPQIAAVRIYNCRRGRGSTAVAKALPLFIYTHIVSTPSGAARRLSWATRTRESKATHSGDGRPVRARPVLLLPACLARRFQHAAASLGRQKRQIQPGLAGPLRQAWLSKPSSGQQSWQF